MVDISVCSGSKLRGVVEIFITRLLTAGHPVHTNIANHAAYEGDCTQICMLCLNYNHTCMYHCIDTVTAKMTVECKKILTCVHSCITMEMLVHGHNVCH